jgi:hypothetical protein
METFFPCSGCNYFFFSSRAVELRQRGKEKIICDNCRGRTSLDSLLGHFVPGVLVVVQGGSGTIKTVASTNAVRFELPKSDQQFDSSMLQSEDRCMPIVVVEGSGKAADFIAFTWRHMHGARPCKCYGSPRSICVAAVRRFDTNDELLLASCPEVAAAYSKIFGEESEDKGNEEEKQKEVIYFLILGMLSDP